MTIQDIMDQLRIDGQVKVSLWKDGEEIKHKLYTDSCKIPPELREKEIKYIYANRNEDFITIEVEEEEDDD